MQIKLILVTGGAGFIGSHLVKRLVREPGTSVHVLDDFSTGRRANLPDGELTSVSNSLTVERGRVEDIDVHVSKNGTIDEIYHLACPASPVHYQRNPVATLHTAIGGTANVLKLAREHHARVVIASTSEVYGSPGVHPQPESYWGHANPIGPRSCYDEGKRAAEAFAVAYRKQYGLDVRIARIFNTYGPQMQPDDGRVISNFIVQALRGEPLTVYGDGSQTRSCCYVADLVDGLVRLMAADPSEDVATPVNLGNPEERTVREIAQAVMDLVNGCTADRIVHKPLPQDDPPRRRPDIERARKLLGWTPKISLEEGLAATVSYFAKRLEKAA
jgi:UDP-glucuronate decarboxylase